MNFSDGPQAFYQGNTILFSNNHTVSVTGSTLINVGAQRETTLIELISSAFKGSFIPSATHDTIDIANPPKCHPGTRILLLNRLSDWVQDADSPTHISWLFGPAGAGKSAIARSLAERLAANGLLAGSFFFCRTDTNRNSIKGLVPTLAYQISDSIVNSRCQIAKAVADNPMIFYQSFQTQFEALITRSVTQILPAASVSSSPARSMLIIIDGLDEFEDRIQRCLILKTVFDAIPRLRGHLKFLVASRPEFDIQSFFKLADVKDHVKIVELLEDARAYDDVRTYLRESFNQLKQTHPIQEKLEADWPPSNSVEELVRKSSGHFIYASTVIKYIASPYDLPTRRLEQILGFRTVSDDPYANLDDLYHNILASGSGLSKVDRRVLIKILSAVLVCNLIDNTILYRFGHDPADTTKSDRFVECLLRLEPGEVRLALIDLKSLIVLNDQLRFKSQCRSDVPAVIKFSHKSFSDFLLNPSRSKEFYVNLEHSYATLARSCMDVLSDCAKLDLLERYWKGLEWDPRPAYHCFLAGCCQKALPNPALFFDYDITNLLKVPAKVTTKSDGIYFDFVLELLALYEKVSVPHGYIFKNLLFKFHQHIKSELELWVPQVPEVMGELILSIFPNHIDSQRLYSSDVGCTFQRMIKHSFPPSKKLWPYFLLWLFGARYQLDQRIDFFCDFFYSRDRRAGDFCLNGLSVKTAIVPRRSRVSCPEVPSSDGVFCVYI